MNEGGGLKEIAEIANAIQQATTAMNELIGQTNRWHGILKGFVSTNPVAEHMRMVACICSLQRSIAGFSSAVATTLSPMVEAMSQTVPGPVLSFTFSDVAAAKRVDVPLAALVSAPAAPSAHDQEPSSHPA
jgi:hypothetical protein